MSAPSAHWPIAGASRPLAGKRVVLTRARAEAGEFEARVRALGGEPILAPAIAIAPPETWTIADAALRRAETYDWIAFTSANAARALVGRANAIGIAREALAGRRLAAVGPATAAAVATVLRTPDVVPATHSAESLAQTLPGVESTRVLFPHGDLASDAFVDGLTQRGAFVDRVIVYRTVPGDGVTTIVDGLSSGLIDALLVTSASAVRFVAEALVERAGEAAVRSLGDRPLVVCIGPGTASVAREAGFGRVIAADSATLDDVIDTTARWFDARR